MAKFDPNLPYHPPTPDTPTWPNEDNLPPELGGSPYTPSKVSGYPSNARELRRPQSPLLSWYGSGNLPPGCVISGGVVTSYHTCDNP